MRKLFTAISAILAIGLSAHAQDIIVPDGYELVDSVVYIPVSSVDAEIDGKSIYAILPSDVTVRQSRDLKTKVESHVDENAEKTFSGYRIRIYFDNKQDSRAESEAEMNRFKAKYHGIQAYRSYSNPFFKVTVGDFRTKAEAQEQLKEIQKDFPTAFVVKEKFRYPVLDAGSYKTDTLKILKQKAE